MRFRFVRHLPPRSELKKETIYLWPTGWDDWFQFSTLFNVIYVKSSDDLRSIGQTKVGEVGLQGARSATAEDTGVRTPSLPKSFSALEPSTLFSLGQDTSYYENLTAIGPAFREQYLVALNDLAYDLERFTAVEQEPVTAVSLLRDVPPATVRNQFHRLARGGARLTPYDFTFPMPYGEAEGPSLSFSVDPDSRPPSNIHVLIGRNGVGKSTVLNTIATSIIESASKPKLEATSPKAWDQFSNVVSVSFSAFDSFDPISVARDRTKGLTAHYVGLKKVGKKASDEAADTKDPAALSREMTLALKTCLLGARRPRLLRALGLLEGDPIFAAIGMRDLINLDDDPLAIESMPKIFKRLSSGHKIVLLTVTKLVETVEEKSLVLLDEPEAHLHPPLLSAFVRTLSDLLTNRNGMAIIATHSPVVLQEVPKSCVWKLQRNGVALAADRPRRETFGENVGILTDEVFGLEVTATGFHRMLFEAAQSAGSYESALSKFEGQLGSEGRALLRSMISALANQDHVAR